MDSRFYSSVLPRFSHPPKAEDSPAISVVIPVYNSALALPLLVERLRLVLDALNQPWEVILVCDSSPDHSWRVINCLVSQHQGFRGILLARNMGQAQATLCGIRATTGDIIVTMDDDLQHEPEALPQLLAALNSEEGYDAVFAWFPHKHHSPWRNLGSRLIHSLNAQAFAADHLRLSSYRLMRRPVADFIRTNPSSVATPGTMILAATRHVKSVPIQHQPRYSGHSNYTLGRQFRLALINLIAVSLLPLRLIVGLGVTTIGCSLLMLLVSLVCYLVNGFGLSSWGVLVILITFFAGLILFALGIVGEYLVRVLRELQYTDAVPVRCTIGF